jgi:hypothetical protein
MLSRRVSILKISWAISRVRWSSFLETNVSKTISVLVLRVVELMIEFSNPEDVGPNKT